MLSVPSPAATPAADVCASLSPKGRGLARLCALFAPRPLPLALLERFIEEASSASLALPDARSLPADMSELVDAGVVQHTKDEVVMASAAALALLRAARAEGALMPLLDALARLRQRGETAPAPSDDPVRTRVDAGDRDRDIAEVLERGYLLAGDVPRFGAVTKNTTHDFSLLAEPFLEEALRAVPPAERSQAWQQCLAQAIRDCAPADALIVACQEISESPLEHADDIAFLRVLQGDFDAAIAVFDDLPRTPRRAAPARAGKASARALVAMLRGDDDEAAGHIDQALRALRGARKRLVFPEGRPFALSLLALARLDTSETRDLLERVAAARQWSQSRHIGLDVAETAVHVKAKIWQRFGLERTGVGLRALFAGIYCCWLGEPPNSETLAALRWLRARASENGFAWVAAECGEILRRVASREEAAAGGELARHRHADLGTATLTTLAVPVGTWEQSLTVIEELAETPEEDDAEAAPAAESTSRLVWKLHIHSGNVSLEARAQRRNANGAWTKGTAKGAKRLAAESTQMNFLLAQDKAAIAAAATRQTWGRKETYFGLATLHALAGHPLVLDSDDRPLEVVRREPELSVAHAADGGVVVRVEPYRAGTDGAYAMRMAAPGRCEITHFTPEHQRLLRAIPPDGLTLPPKGRQRLLNTVPGLAARVRVASDVQNLAVAAARVEADAEPWVRLEPLDAGLSVALEVEPVAGSGNCFPPAAGGVVVFAIQDGENVQAERDFDAEQQAVAQLVERCPPLAVKPIATQPLFLPNADDCLELLELLEAAEARCKWPHGPAMRLAGRADNRSLRISVQSAAQWVQASGELRVNDDQVLSLKRLFALLEDNPDSRFLPLGDGEFLALADSFRRRLDDFAAIATARENAVRMPPLAALALEDLLEGAVLDADDGWDALRERMRAASAYNPEVPGTLQAELRPYQVAGFEWLARQAEWGAGACLADDMGLGKTIQTLALLLLRAQDGPALVVAPTSVLPNWLAEGRRFAPSLAVKTYTGAAAARAALLEEVGAFDLVLTTYGVLQNDIEQLAARTWHTVVLDEAQAIKNPNAQRSKAAKRLQADFRVITTGTPVQNNLLDLHSLFGFAVPGLLGPLRQFHARFALPIERDGSPVAQKRLKRLVDPFVLRRLKTDVLDDLPSRTEITLHVKMSEAEVSLYEALRQRALDELASEAGGGQMRMLAHLTRLRLACCNPKLVLDAADAPPDLPLAETSAKLATFAATLEDLLANRHKVLVFSQFVRHLRLIEEHLREVGVAYQYLDGATPVKERATRIAAFQAGEGDVFLISLTAGGVGLNLTAADYVIHMDPWWNPAVEDQASDRAHRIGQTRPVTIYRLVTEGTIEEQIVELHHRKRDLAEQLLAATDAPGRLDVEEMMELLRQPLGA